MTELWTDGPMTVGTHLHRLLLQVPLPTVARVASLVEAEAMVEVEATAEATAEATVEATAEATAERVVGAASPAEDAAALLGLPPVGMDRPTIHRGVDTENGVDMDRGVALALVITFITLANGYTSRHPAALIQVNHTIARAASQGPRVVKLVDAASLEEDAALLGHLHLPLPMMVGADGADTEDGPDTTMIGPRLAPGMAARVASLVLVEDPRAPSLTDPAAAPRGPPLVGMDQHTIHPGVDMQDGADITVIGPRRATPLLVPAMVARVARLVLVEDPRAPSLMAAPRGLPLVGTHQVQTTFGLVDGLALPHGMEVLVHLQAARRVVSQAVMEVEAIVERVWDAASLEDAVPLRLLQIPMMDGLGMDTVKTMEGNKHGLAHQALSSVALLP